MELLRLNFTTDYFIYNSVLHKQSQTNFLSQQFVSQQFELMNYASDRIFQIFNLDFLQNDILLLIIPRRKVLLLILNIHICHKRLFLVDRSRPQRLMILAKNENELFFDLT